MKRILVITLILIVGICFCGCEKNSVQIDEKSENTIAEKNKNNDLEASSNKSGKVESINTNDDETFVDFEPIVYEGNGDDVIEIRTIDSPYVIYVNGNEESRYFGIILYDDSSKRLTSIVNVTEPVDGVFIDEALMKTKYLEIKSKGYWRIEQRSINTLDTISRGETYSGQYYNVLRVLSYGNTAYITGNEESRYFGVTEYNPKGKRITSLVNTTTPYEGKVMIKKEPALIEIQAKGEWTITLE